MANNGFAKPVLLQVATKGELAKCPDMLLGRYNGHPDEDMSPIQLDNRGADMQWYWKDKHGQVHSGWPLRVRAGGYVAIPNCKENLDILEKMKAHKWSTQERGPNGPVARHIDHPPLYELVTEEVVQVSPEALMAAFAALSPEAKARIMGDLTAPEQPAQPTETNVAGVASGDAGNADEVSTGDSAAPTTEPKADKKSKG